MSLKRNSLHSQSDKIYVNGLSLSHFRNYGRVQSPMCDMSTLNEYCLARRHHFIDIEITKCVFLIGSHVKILSSISITSTRTATEVFIIYCHKSGVLR